MLDNIPRQKQVLQDIYNILSQIAVDVQPPENVAINTTDNIHTIQNFGYNLNPKHYGSYEYAISLKIGVDYNIKNLTATILTAHIGNIFPELIKKVDENANENLHEAKKTECKYKIQSSENFKTQPYCSILNKFCEEVSFVCDKNCQVFEDFKQLARAKDKIDYMEEYIKTVENARNDLERELAQKEQEYEKLRQYHNKYCEENAEKLEQWLEKYSPLSSVFDNGKYCNKENCNLLKAKEQECNNYKQALDSIENICRNVLDDDYIRNLAFALLDIINKAKDE